jgi:copper homeostasis protein (lipoprotein)
MQTIRKAVKKILAPLLISCLIGFNSAFAESTGGAGTQHTAKTLNLSGLYLGFFPCADCQGIRTTLALNNNNSYVYISLYVGKSDREFVEKGKFSLGEDGNTLVLTPRKGSTTVQKYLIEDDMLIKLDEDGERITKDGADGYILKRKDVVKQSGSGNHAEH